MKKMSFEQSLERLEEIVKLLETGSAPLEESTRLYEEGIAFVRVCNAMLEQTEARIRLLRTGTDGGVEEVPMPEMTDGSSGVAPDGTPDK